MKRLMILSAMCLLFFTATLYAQTPADSLAIEKACRDYVEGWAAGESQREMDGNECTVGIFTITEVAFN